MTTKLRNVVLYMPSNGCRRGHFKGITIHSIKIELRLFLFVRMRTIVVEFGHIQYLSLPVSETVVTLHTSMLTRTALDRS